MFVYPHVAPQSSQTAWRLESMGEIRHELTSLAQHKMPTNLSDFLKQFARPDFPGPRLARRATYKLWQVLVRIPLTIFLFMIVAFILDTQTPLGDFLAPLPFILGLIVAFLLVMGATFFRCWKLWRNFRVPQQTLMNDFRIDLLPHIKKYNSACQSPHSPEFGLACEGLAYAMLWFQSRNPLTPYRLYQPTDEVAVAPRPYADPNNYYSPFFMETIYRGNKSPSLEDLFKNSPNERLPLYVLQFLSVPFSRVLVRAALGWLIASTAVFGLSKGYISEHGLLFVLANSVLLGSSVGIVLVTKHWQNKLARQRIRLICDNPANTISLGSLHQALRIELMPVLAAYERGEVKAETVLQAYTLFMGRYPVTPNLAAGYRRLLHV